jgi:hypothetical protein
MAIILGMLDYIQRMNLVDSLGDNEFYLDSGCFEGRKAGFVWSTAEELTRPVGYIDNNHAELLNSGLSELERPCERFKRLYNDATFG